MAAVTKIAYFNTEIGAEEYLTGLGYVYVKCTDTWLDSGKHWATIDQLAIGGDAGKWMVRIGVSTR